MSDYENEVTNRTVSVAEEYPIRRKGLFVVIADEVEQERALIQLNEEFHLKENEGGWDRVKHNVKAYVKKSFDKDQLESFIENDVCKDGLAQDPAYFILFFMVDAKKIPWKTSKIVSRMQQISDKFLDIPKVFIVQVCFEKRFNRERKDSDSKDPDETEEPENYLPEEADCYIMLPCVHLDSVKRQHPTNNLTFALIAASQDVRENLDGQRSPDAENQVGGWIEDIGTRVRARGDESGQFQCISTLKSKLSWIKILEQQGVIDTPYQNQQ